MGVLRLNVLVLVFLKSDQDEYGYKSDESDKYWKYG